MGSQWLKELFSDEDMSFYKDSIGGRVKGHNLAVKKYANSVMVKVTGNVSVISENEYEECIKSWERDFGKFKKTKKASGYILIEMKDFPTKKQFLENITKITENLCSLLDKHKAINCCELCGREGPGSFYCVGRLPYFFCEKCSVKRKQEIDKERAQKKKSRIFPGILGALIGTLPGAALWTGIIFYGLYNGLAGVAGSIIAAGALLGYRLLGKHMDKASAISVSIVSLFMIFAANHLAFTFLAQYYIGRKVGNSFLFTITTVIRWVNGNYFFGTFIPGLSSYWLSLIAGIVLGAVTFVVYFILHKGHIRKKYEFKAVR